MPENRQMGAFLLHVILFVCTTFMVTLWFLFYHYRKLWLLIILNILNITGIVCLFLEAMTDHMNISSWLFGFFSVFHYGGVLGLIFLNYHHRHLCYCKNLRCNCFKMSDMRRYQSLNCLFCRRQYIDEVPSEMVYPFGGRWQSSSDDNNPQKNRLRLLFANEKLFPPAHKKSITGSLVELPRDSTSEDDQPITEIMRYKRKTSSAPEISDASNTKICYTIICQAEIHGEPKDKNEEKPVEEASGGKNGEVGDAPDETPSTSGTKKVEKTSSDDLDKIETVPAESDSDNSYYHYTFEYSSESSCKESLSSEEFAPALSDTADGSNENLGASQ